MGGHHLLLPTALQFCKKRRRYEFAPTQLRASRINWKERKTRGCERRLLQRWKEFQREIIYIPACYPWCKRSPLGTWQLGTPKVKATWSGEGRTNLCHGQTHKHGEETSDEPSIDHGDCPSICQSCVEQCCHSCKDGDDCKGECKIRYHSAKHTYRHAQQNKGSLMNHSRNLREESLEWICEFEWI